MMNKKTNRMNKKGFLILPLIYIGMIIAVLVLLLVFGLRISEGLQAVFGFLTKWWWAFLIVIVLVILRKPVIAIFSAILGKIGIKV